MWPAKYCGLLNFSSQMEQNINMDELSDNFSSSGLRQKSSSLDFGSIFVKIGNLDDWKKSPSLTLRLLESFENAVKSFFFSFDHSSESSWNGKNKQKEQNLLKKSLENLSLLAWVQYTYICIIEIQISYLWDML